MPSASLVDHLNTTFTNLTLSERVEQIAQHFSHAVFTTSLGLEDQLLTMLVASHTPAIEAVTLQTGRLFPQTLELIAKTEQRYALPIKRYEPEPNAVESYIGSYGLDGFYESVEARKACCSVRKVVPLARALEGADAWITGLRRNQSENRRDILFAELDETRGLTKLNPLADLSSENLRALIVNHDIPTNPLHARGYPSIGCEPCTRAIKPGEPERAGRWWWEQESKQECGLHIEAAAGPELEKAHA
jgi:phosphoadenosine phosphosulfate reductase